MASPFISLALSYWFSQEKAKTFQDLGNPERLSFFRRDGYLL